MRYDIQKMLLPLLQRRQLQDGYKVLRNHDTSLPRLPAWQGVRLLLQLHGAESIWRWRSPRLVWHPKIHYLVEKRARATGRYSNQLKLARTILFKAHLCMGVPTGCFLFGFSYQNCTCISPLNDSTPPPPKHRFHPALTRISKLIVQLSPFFSFYLQIFCTRCSPTPSVYVLSIAL
jgi:hypothetical protein